jgi:ribosome-binding protein aMBF1 (putative translation factor)
MSDDLQDYIQERAEREPDFPAAVEAAYEARLLLRKLAKRRVAAGLSQTAIAARMKTSQSAVARIEAGEADVRISTVERYAAALGRKVEFRLVATGSARHRGTR